MAANPAANSRSYIRSTHPCWLLLRQPWSPPPLIRQCLRGSKVAVAGDGATTRWTSAMHLPRHGCPRGGPPLLRHGHHCAGCLLLRYCTRMREAKQQQQARCHHLGSTEASETKGASSEIGCAAICFFSFRGVPQPLQPWTVARCCTWTSAVSLRSYRLCNSVT